MKVLALLPRFPQPLDKGDRLRAFHLLQQLATRHEVVLCALSHGPVRPAELRALTGFCRRVEVLSLSRAESGAGLARAFARGLPLQVGYFHSPRAARRLRELAREERPQAAFYQLVRTAEYAGLEAPATLDYMDAFAWGLEQRAAHRPGALGPLLRMEAARLRRYEAAAFERFAARTIITEQDRQQIAHPLRERIQVVGNGVDPEAFRPRPREPDVDLLFVGHMGYPPNVLAAERLVREVLPRVRRQRPASVLIVGTRPARRVRRLAGEGVTVTGFVDDVAPCYARARVFVAPMAVGTGLQNKLLQALAMGRPCVTSPAARAALGAGPEEVLAGADSGEIAAHLVELLADPRRAEALGRRGREFALARFRWPDAAARLEQVLLGSRG